LPLKVIPLSIPVAVVVVAIPIVPVSRSAIDPKFGPTAVINPNSTSVNSPVVPFDAPGLAELAVEFDIVLVGTAHIAVHPSTIVRFATKVLGGPCRNCEENGG
jgi:hypothetical protein